MEYEKIKQLMDDMGNSKLTSVDIEFPDGIKIKMEKKNEIQVIASKEFSTSNIENTITPNQTVITNENLNIIPESKNVVSKQENELNGEVVKSPMIGTFYSKPNPDSKEFVKVGDKVKLFGKLTKYNSTPEMSNGQVTILPADPELKITSELKQGTDELGDSYTYVDFDTVEYGQTASVVIAIEGTNLPTKVITYPDGITEEEVDNFVTFALSTYPFFDIEIEGGKAETVIDPWFGNEMTNYVVILEYELWPF